MAKKRIHPLRILKEDAIARRVQRICSTSSDRCYSGLLIDRPFMVNASDIPAKQPSPANDLSENQQRGMDRIKRLSNDALSVSREGSPVPRGRLSEDMSSKDAANDKRKIEELQILNKQLRDNLLQKLNTEDEVTLLKGKLDSVHHHNTELKQKMENQQRDYEIMSKNYLDHVRLVRVTDDDHSTIKDRLVQLKGAIEHLIKKAQGYRSVNLNKPAAIDYLNDSGKLTGFPISPDKLEPYQLNLFMESMIMSTLVSFFFEKPLSCVFDYNKGFKDIYDWMHTRNPALAVRWRQQLCVMITQDPETDNRQNNEVELAVAAISEIVSKVYTSTDEAVKIRDICKKAVGLSVAMTGLESVIAPETVPIGTAFDEETMQAAHKSNSEGMVVLVVFPAFKDQVDAFSIAAKVWCY